MDWFENQLIPALAEPTLIVLDNAPYHNLKVADSVSPTMSTRKSEMQAWLTTKGISYAANMTKPMLYELIKQNKPPIRYQTDEIAENHGHAIVRTPVRHCELNVIELIWANMKAYVARNNCTFKISDVKRLVNEAFDKITATDWLNAENHVKKTEQKMRQLDGMQDYNPVVISLNSDSDTSDDELLDMN